MTSESRPEKADLGHADTSRSAPTVSIGIPVFNGGRTLRHTLDALLAQSLQDFEIIISDNASSDDTQDICLEYAAADPRIRYVRNEENLGARPNYNGVFELARGEFFRWNGHDDWIAPTYLERCVDTLRRDPGAVACYTAWCWLPDELRPPRIRPADEIAVSTNQFRRYHDSLWSLPYQPIWGMFRTRVLRETDLIPNCPEPDRITLVQVALLGRFRQINEVLLFRRKRKGSRKVWTWLDPANRHAPKRRVMRVLRELWRAVDRFATGGRASRVAMKADAVAFVVVGSLRGKLLQHVRRVKLWFVKRRLQLSRAATDETDR